MTISEFVASAYQPSPYGEVALKAVLAAYQRQTGIKVRRGLALVELSAKYKVSQSSAGTFITGLAPRTA